MQKIVFLVSALFLAGCTVFDPDLRVSVNELRIDNFGTSRGLEYSNGAGSFFATETNGDHRVGRHGWRVLSRRILDDYLLTVDNRELGKSQVHLAQVYPHQFQRAYPIGVQETVTLLDSLDAIVVELSVVKGSMIGIRPLFSAPGAPADYEIRAHGNTAVLKRNSDGRAELWLGATVIGDDPAVVQTPVDNGTLMSPVLVQASVVNGAVLAIFTAGSTEEQVLGQIRYVTENYRDLIDRRRMRMQKLVDRVGFRTSDQRLDMAVNWALISMDGLMAGQSSLRTTGTEYGERPGREILHSIPGGLLVSGNFPVAKEILRFFAERQDRNPASSSYGRIPSRISSAQVFYTSADVTPRFVEALGEYVNYSGDTAFARLMFPTVRRAIEGTLKHRVDRHALLTHGDAETWMDIVGPQGPETPRGNRANDIQALWYRQLLISTWLAGIAEDEKSFREWFSYAEQVQISFNRLFVDPATKRIYDRLNANGSPDRRLRANQILTLELIEDPSVRFDVFRQTTESLVYAHGVGSLFQGDPDFHPYAAQGSNPHNGLVWTWLAGPWISAATQFGYYDTAYKVTNTMIRQILDRGTIGTLGELFEAATRTGGLEPLPAGSASGVGLAELLRNIYQDYLGVAVDAVENKLELAPHLPSSVSDAAFNVAVGPNTIRVRYKRSSSEGTINLSSPAGAPTIDVVATWRLESGIEHNFAYMLPPLTEAEISIQMDGVYVEDRDGSRKLQMNIIRGFDPDSSLVPISLAMPKIAAEHNNASTH